MIIGVLMLVSCSNNSNSDSKELKSDSAKIESKNQAELKQNNSSVQDTTTIQISDQEKKDTIANIKENQVSIEKLGISFSLPKSFTQVGKVIEAKDLQGNVRNTQVIYKDSVLNAEITIKMHNPPFAEKLYETFKNAKNAEEVKIAGLSGSKKTMVFDMNGKGQKLDVPEKIVSYFLLDNGKGYEIILQVPENNYDKAEKELNIIVNSLNIKQ